MSQVSDNPIVENVNCERSKVLVLGSPPGTGKSTWGPLIAAELSRRTGETWLFLDNEWGFTREMRVECSVQSGLQLDTPEFARAFNRLGQMGYQQMIANLARQGVNIVAVGPFEDLTAMVGERNLLELLRDVQFADFEFQFHYVLLWPDEAQPNELSDQAIMAPVEAEIRRRLETRGDSDSVQRALDAPKLMDVNYYQARALKVVRSATVLNLNITRHSIAESAESVAEAVCDAVN